MFWSTGLFLVLAVSQVPAELVQPEFIENVIAASSPSSRIVSGWAARPGQIPYQVSLRLVNPAGAVQGCGGSVVSRDWVLSAAHCTAGMVTVVVRAGLTELPQPEYMMETQEWYNHPSYNDLLTAVQSNDISIIKLQRPVTYSRHLQAIRIQPSTEAFRDYDLQRVQASGFGITWTNGASPEHLNYVYLTAVSNHNCAMTFGTNLINDNAICARFYNVTSQSTCQGDSGGPLVEDRDGVPVLIGVASFVAGGSFGCHSGLPAGFIRPGPFLPWFKQVTGVDFENLDEEEDEVITTTVKPETEPPQTTVWLEPTEITTSPPQATTQIATTASPKPTEAPEETTVIPPTTEEESESDSEESDEVSNLLQKISVQVKVKVKVNNELKTKVKVKCNE